MTFLFFMAGALTLLAVFIWLFVRSTATTPPPLGQFQDNELSALAWASGGPGRVLQLWWVSLLSAGQLRPAPSSGLGWDFEVLPHENQDTDPWIDRAATALLPGRYTRAQISNAWKTPLQQLRHELVDRGLIFFNLYPFRHPVTPSGRDWRRNRLAQATAATRAPQASTLGLAVAAGGLAVLASTPFSAMASHVQPVPSSSSGGCGASAGGGCGSTSSAVASSSSGFATGGGVGGGDSGTGGDGGSSGCGGGGCGGCGG